MLLSLFLVTLVSFVASILNPDCKLVLAGEI
jgi:hypothetical protein